MVDQFSRLRMLTGPEAVDRLHECRVMVFGVGGVGQCVVEGLARSGIGHFELVDPDCVNLSNLNRQLFTTHENIGMNKAEAGAQRIHQINPDAEVNVHKIFYLPGQEEEFDFTRCDYVADAVDTVSAKIGIILEAKRAGVPVISAMGCGNRFDPTLLRIDDIYHTQNDPLAKVMRHELSRRGVKHLKVCYSLELPSKPREKYTELEEDNPPERRRRSTPGSTAFVPTAAGFAIAGQIVRDLIGG